MTDEIALENNTWLKLYHQQDTGGTMYSQIHTIKTLDCLKPNFENFE